MKPDIKIQLFEVEISNASKPVIKDAFDKDYKYFVGISIPDENCSDKSIIKIAKVKGFEFLPNDFEAINIISSKAVDPNKRFFCLFDPIRIYGDDLELSFYDTNIVNPYTLKLQVLLTNDPEELRNVFFS